jgi:nicotinate-nucleotide--dimethylbenzimidazole phosphoribosyltransferase
MDLFEAINKRRDTRHFTNDEVPQEVINLCLQAAKNAPSVGLTEPSRFIFIDDQEIKKQIHQIFVIENEKAIQNIEDQERKEAYKNLKLQGILEAPIGMIVCSDHSTINNYTIGVNTMQEAVDWSVCCSIQNFWLALTSQSFSMGWVSIINVEALKNIIDIPAHFKPLGYFCIGKPATDYGKMPMLKQQGWSNQ